jgi:hypothetical protein
MCNTVSLIALPLKTWSKKVDTNLKFLQSMVDEGSNKGFKIGTILS